MGAFLLYFIDKDRGKYYISLDLEFMKRFFLYSIYFSGGPLGMTKKERNMTSKLNIQDYETID